MAIDHQAGSGSGLRSGSGSGSGSGLVPGQPMSVGQLAASAGVRADTVRYYERAGLLPPPDRTEGDHRRYGPADVDRLLFIRGARRLGLRLAEIRELVTVRDTGTCPCGPAELLLREHVREIDREIARLAALRSELAAMIDSLSSPAMSCQDPLPGAWCTSGLNDQEGKEVTAMESCCDDSACNGSCCDCDPCCYASASAS